jgi:hypothetical protein
LLGLFLVRRSPSTKAESKSDSAQPHPAQQPLAPASVQVARPAAATVVAHSVVPPLAAVRLASDGLPYMPAAADAPALKGFVHPHPITPEHARIFRENATIQALNDAMDDQDAATLRRFLARYRSEYPEDAQGLQQGYALIADCLEQQPGSAAAAQRYFDEERGSSLRRFVRRHCLGGA